MLRRVATATIPSTSLSCMIMVAGNVGGGVRFGSTNSVPLDTTTSSPPSVPHPRVRQLYKEFISLAALHPIFTMEKCRGLIKARFRTNATIPIYNNDHHDDVEGAAEKGVVAEEVADHHEATSHKKSNPYTPEFQKALAWGRFNLSELEAFYHIHKFRAMRRYDWSAEADRKSADQFIASLDAKKPSS